VKILIVGISGKLGRSTAVHLARAGHQIAGIDQRAWPGAPAGVPVHVLDIRKRPAADVFRRFQPDAVVHLATVAHVSMRTEEELRENLGNTRAVFDACRRHAVPQVVFVGRHTFYGAAADASLYHTEEEPPLEVASFPQLADLVAADLYAGSAFWRFPAMATAVLRIVYALGPSHRGTLAGLLDRRYVPAVLGFDPLIQFIHEDDAGVAIALAVTKKLRGVFNVAGPPPLPLSVLARLAGRRWLPLPEPLFRFAAGRGLSPLPAAAVMHLKFPVIVDDAAFRKATGFLPTHDVGDIVRSFVAGDSARRASPTPE
jgi:UDP-glucose 4-epimerase